MTPSGKGTNRWHGLEGHLFVNVPSRAWSVACAVMRVVGKTMSKQDNPWFTHVHSENSLWLGLKQTKKQIDFHHLLFQNKVSVKSFFGWRWILVPTLNQFIFGGPFLSPSSLDKGCWWSLLLKDHELEDLSWMKAVEAGLWGCWPHAETCPRKLLQAHAPPPRTVEDKKHPQEENNSCWA